MEASLSEWFGGDFVFDGVVRWQLWFDNPNKTAVMFAEMAILGLAVLFAGNWRRAVMGSLLFLLPSLALVQTFSRGGFVAWMAATLAVLWRRIREFGWSRRVVVVVGVMVVVSAASMHWGLSRRMADGFSGGDRSVENRLDLWRCVPQMMRDAPFGWGLGNAGSAYMSWYQPLERSERYRTVVNSHLTWFVETGWIGMAVWMSFWIGILYFGTRVGMTTHRWICFAEWFCLGISGVFSSVMESPWLWVVPVVAVLYEVTAFGKERLYCIRRCVMGGFISGGLLTVAGFIGAKMFCDVSRVLKSVGCVEYRGNYPVCWVVVDVDVLGGPNYPRVLREFGACPRSITFRLLGG